MSKCNDEKLKNGDKDWENKCEVCGQLPTVHPTGLCGPCCFGEADTFGGKWRANRGGQKWIGEKQH